VKRHEYSDGLLLIDGVAVGACNYTADALKATLQDELPSGPISATFKMELDPDGTKTWDKFVREAGLQPMEAPLFDMVFWLALDPRRGVMPVVAVDELSEVITVCKRGGGSLGRVWRGCSVELKQDDGQQA